jgi:hypothetical protein
MARFYFEMRQGGTIIPDLEGQEFVDLAGAKTEADAVLHELVGADIAARAPILVRSCAIHDEDGRLLAAVRLMALEKEDTSPLTG